MVRQETYMAIDAINPNQYQFSFGGLSGQRGQQVQGGHQGIDVNGQTQRTNKISCDNQYVTNAALFNSVSALDKPSPETRTETQGQNLYLMA